MQITCLSDGLSVPVCAGMEDVLQTHLLCVLCAFLVLVVLQDGHAHLLWQWLHRPHGYSWPVTTEKRPMSAQHMLLHVLIEKTTFKAHVRAQLMIREH